VHNIWDGGWPVLITISGWLAVFGGLVRMMIPDQSAAMARKFIDNTTAVTTSALIMLALGAFLSFKGFALG